MGLLTGAEILAADDLPFEDVEVPEWGGTVRVRALRAGERREFEKRIEPDSVDSRTLLVGACLVGEDGKQLFTPEQFASLAAKSSVPIVRLLKVCMRLNCIGDAEEEAKKK